MAVIALSISVARAMPSMETRVQDGVTIDVPAGWKLLVTSDEHNLVTSRDAYTQITLHWYPYREGASLDKMTDKLIEVTNRSLKVGSYEESRRYNVVDGRGMLSTGRWVGPLGFSLALGFSTILDPARGRIVSAVFFTSPESWAEMEGANVLVAVSNGLRQAPR
jgi:hypothetical protein